MIADKPISFIVSDAILEEGATTTTYDRVVGTYSDDISTFDVMSAMEASGTLDFWDDPREDIYSEHDGDPA